MSFGAPAAAALFRLLTTEPPAMDQTVAYSDYSLLLAVPLEPKETRPRQGASSHDEATKRDEAEIEAVAVAEAMAPPSCLCGGRCCLSTSIAIGPGFAPNMYASRPTGTSPAIVET